MGIINKYFAFTYCFIDKSEQIHYILIEKFKLNKKKVG